MVWHKHCNPLQARAGSHLLLPWLERAINNRCGLISDYAQWWALRLTSSLGLVPYNTEMCLCSSHAGNGGTLSRLLTVPSIPGSRGPTLRLGPIVKTRHATESGISMRLFGECGFDFLPETDLQKRPGLEVVMTVGLHLCALEMTDQQLDTLACIALAGQLPEFFPLQHWISAVKKSFLSQEVVTCATRAQWNEVCAMLEAVNTTEISLRSKNGTTLWTRASHAYQPQWMMNSHFRCLPPH